MLLEQVYLDYNATAPMPGSVADKIAQVMREVAGNASSLHASGRKARQLLEESRERLAARLHTAPRELVFTSGGSESNNMVLKQFQHLGPQAHLIVSTIEHPSVLEACSVLEKLNAVEVTRLEVTSAGLIMPETLKQALRENTRLISIMTVNNEVGTIQPIAHLAGIARKHKIPFHTDAVQALGRLDLDWGKDEVVFASAAAHKIGGPKGIGLLYVRQGQEVTGLIHGGKQERVRRAGTEAVALACGFAEAMDLVCQQREALQTKLAEFRQQLLDQLQTLPGFFLNTPLHLAVANTLNFGFEGISAESLLISLDLDGVEISTGSACSSGAVQASHVLLAMGLEKHRAKSCIRVSMGWNTKASDVAKLTERLIFHVERLRAKQQRKAS